MALDLTVRTVTYAGSDHSWLGSQHGTEANRSVTLDLSKFDFASTFTSKMIPSGVVLAKITASGLYGPYNDGLSNGQEVATGFLFTDVDVANMIADAGSTTLTGKRQSSPPCSSGESSRSPSLPTGHGLDTAGRVDLKAASPASVPVHRLRKD
jgi:hypothetical protein